uniref:Uncharacterized protein n=1 Tax=Cannabis sativa TaxID=3483 RepID=A0A803PJR5_CANSA
MLLRKNLENIQEYATNQPSTNTSKPALAPNATERSCSPSHESMFMRELKSLYHILELRDQTHAKVLYMYQPRANLAGRGKHSDGFNHLSYLTTPIILEGHPNKPPDKKMSSSGGHSHPTVGLVKREDLTIYTHDEYEYSLSLYKEVDRKYHRWDHWLMSGELLYASIPT